IRNLGSPGGGGPPAVGRPAPPDGAGGGRASGEGTRCPGASVTRADLSRSAKPASTNWRINVVAPMPRASAAARMRWSTSTGRRRERLTMGTSVSGAGRFASTPAAMTSDRSWSKTSLIRASHVLGEHGDLIGEHVAGGHDVPVVVLVRGLHDEHNQVPAQVGDPEHRVGVLAHLPGQSPLCAQDLPDLGRVDAVHGDVVQSVAGEAVAVPHTRNVP